MKVQIRFIAVLAAGFIIVVSCAKRSFAVPVSAGSVERSQELIQNDRELMQQIEQEDKFFIGKIVLKGSTKLSEEEINKIVIPYQNQFVTKNDIHQVISAIKAAYEKKGVKAAYTKVSYKLTKAGILEIALNEVNS